MTKQITIRMPKELLAKWLAALRSGDFQQCRGSMMKVDEGQPGFCCLGVLAKVADADESEMARGTPSRRFLDSARIEFVTEGPKSNGLMDSADAGNPYLPPIQNFATCANDGGRTFAEIADAIEACSEGV